MKDLTKIDGVQAKGGCVTARDEALLPYGAFSFAQNIRNGDSGMEQRPGQRKLHTVADGTNQVKTLYQFSKTHRSEKHFYAQMSDGDILEATNEPPTVTTGAFGNVIFDGAAGQVPAAWGVIDDKLIFSNGKDQHQIYAGDQTPVEKFVVYKGSAAIPTIPQGGEDYSDQVIDSADATVAILDAINTYAAFQCIFIRTCMPVKAFNFTVASANTNASTMSVFYWNGSWTSVGTTTDTTEVSSATLGKSGKISWTPPADIITRYAFGTCGWWYQLRFSAQLSATVRLSEVSFDTQWTGIVNVWNSVPDYAVEVQVEGDSQYEVWAAGSVDLSELAAGKKVYIGFSSPVEAIYLDPGGTPTAAGNSIATLKYWNGYAFTTVGAWTDGSSGITQAGWVTFSRVPAQPHQLHTTIYYAYWYELTFANQIQDNTTIAIQGMPYYDILDLGKSSCNAVWKDRACYSFDRWGAYIYVSAKDQPMVLNGADYGILKAGDGRANRVVGMRRFHNELMVWQAELGVEGGCVTIFEGYSPSTFGKLVLTSKIGGMNHKAIAVVDGVLTATKTDETLKTLAFWLSRYGVCVSDGVTVSITSDDIQNYFDPTRPECIRYGYEDQMWLDHDPTHNVIRIGLVSGSSATVPNVFPVFDLVTKTWSFDKPGQPLACMTNIESKAGTQYPVVQVGGGTADGTVYQLNYGIDDVSTPVEMIITQVLTRKAMVLQLHELLIRFKAQNAGVCRLDVLQGDNLKFTRALTMTGERSGESSRRHRFRCEAVGDLIKIRLSNASRQEKMILYEIGAAVKIWEPR